MKVSVVGAGPAGLYLAILLKKADPRHEIEIVERNAPDATFGWGVVFSGETLGALRDADLPTYLEITDSFARWDAVDVRYRDQLLTSRGHAFAGIARPHLLAILQRRCAQLQVKMEFGAEVDGPAGVDSPLVVAADGVNSMFRRAHADHFGSEVIPQGGKYVWFGTDLVLDAFRFIFKQTEHGLFQVHSYPFDEHTSTFIVECPELVWRSAGLDAMTEEESIAFCEQLFADDLGGHLLLSNRSLWLDFLRVRNSTWHLSEPGRHVVLLGDAAHTAHFSIGSGTKLAMEDAIALANALVRYGDGGDDVEAAIADYELDRQPMVERVQAAADDSAAYFQRVSHHTGFEPPQFAMNLLTRSRRISHGNLAQRDPGFVRRFDAWFVRDHSAERNGQTPTLNVDSAAALASDHRVRDGYGDDEFAPPPLFTPITLGGVTLRNRVASPPTQPAPSVPPSPSAALAVLPVAVTRDGRVTTNDRTADDLDEHEITKAHDLGQAVMIRLGHAGRRGATQPRTRGVDLPLADDGWPLVSASPVPYGPLSVAPKQLDPAGMKAVTTAFADATRQAARVGADAVELDAAHGYLLASFLSPLSNLRDDEYGRVLANRARFPLEVISAVREAWPGDKLLAVRLTVDDWRRGGLTLDDGVALARMVAAAGVQLVHVEAGQTVPNDRPEYRRGYLTTAADRVRTEAGVATMVGGHLTTLDEVNTIVAAGRADLCVLEARS